MASESGQTQGEVRTINSSKKEVYLEVPDQTVKEEFERALEEYASRAKIAGFRVGKAPKDLVKQRFYADVRQSVIDSLAPKALARSLRDRGIEPVATPVLTDIHFKEGEALRFTALVEVWPEFDLPQYKKVNIKKREAKIDDKEVDRYLESVRQRAAEYVPVEGRGVADGDYVVAQIQGRDVKSKRLFPTEKVVILAGQPDNEKEVNENLLGLSSGEERVFTITYPDDHPNKKLAGREVEYRLKVVSIKEKKLPLLDDEFAKDLGESKGLADLKTRVREDLLKAKEGALKEEMGDEIVAQLAAQVTLELPETPLAEEAEGILNRTISASGRPPRAEDVGPLREGAKRRAAGNIKRRLILKKVAEAESLAVSPDEIEEELKRIAKANDLSLAKVRESFEPEERKDDLKSHLLLRKAVDFLIENAIIG